MRIVVSDVNESHQLETAEIRLLRFLMGITKLSDKIQKTLHDDEDE
jgi:hypothetical protein